MSSKKDTAAPPTTSIEALEAEAFTEALAAAKTPGEKLALIYAKQTRDEQRRQTEILGAGHRLATNVDSHVRERIRQTDERHVEIAAERREWLVTVDVSHTLDGVHDAPIVTIRCRLGGYIRGASEDRAGSHMVGQISGWELTEAESLVRADATAPFLRELEELDLRGDSANGAILRSRIEGRGAIIAGGAAGVAHRMWSEVRKPIMQKLIVRDRSLEDLIARNTCRLVGEIQVSDEALKTELLPMVTQMDRR